MLLTWVIWVQVPMPQPQEWRNGKRAWFRFKRLGVRISLPVLIASLAKLEKASHLSRENSWFESKAKYIITCGVKVAFKNLTLEVWVQILSGYQTDLSRIHEI